MLCKLGFTLGEYLIYSFDRYHIIQRKQIHVDIMSPLSWSPLYDSFAFIIEPASWQTSKGSVGNLNNNMHDFSFLVYAIRILFHWWPKHLWNQLCCSSHVMKICWSNPQCYQSYNYCVNERNLSTRCTPTAKNDWKHNFLLSFSAAWNKFVEISSTQLSSCNFVYCTFLCKRLESKTACSLDNSAHKKSTRNQEINGNPPFSVSTNRC